MHVKVAVTPSNCGVATEAEAPLSARLRAFGCRPWATFSKLFSLFSPLSTVDVGLPKVSLQSNSDSSVLRRRQTSSSAASPRFLTENKHAPPRLTRPDFPFHPCSRQPPA